MKKKLLVLVLSAVMAVGMMSGCGAKSDTSDTKAKTAENSSAKEEETEEQTECELEDGTYTAEFKTDSGMFHVNEANDGKGTLTVKDGKMTIHVSLVSKNIVNLFEGTSEDAQKDGAELLGPTTDTVTYSDGATEEVYGFDIPVPAIDEEFDLALIGKKGTWYDHKVRVENPVSGEAEDAEAASSETENSDDAADAQKPAGQTADVADGTYTCEVTLQGGSGRASVDSPATIIVKDGKVTADIVWSSTNYEYMLVDDVQYDPIQTEGNSEFQIPVTLDEDVAVSALTVAMSQPHLIDYTLHFDSVTLSEVTK